MSKFFFNDYDSDRDLIITSPIVRPSWYYEFSQHETCSVSKVIQFSKCLGTASLDVNAVIMDTSATRLKKLYSSLRGYGKLILSSNTDEYINAVAKISQPVGVSKRMAEIRIKFDLIPFVYAVESTVFDISADNTIVKNKGNIFSAPIISFIAGSTDTTLNINSAEFTVKITESDTSLSGKQIFIDSDLQDTYYIENENKISINQLTYGEYPLVANGFGNVSISGDVTSAKIDMRERWL